VISRVRYSSTSREMFSSAGHLDGGRALLEWTDMNID
jgi:hypothetical protein